MRIAMISTYPPIECGIATYAENLCNAFSRQEDEIVVISQHGAQGAEVFPVYNAADDNIAAEIFNMLSKLTPDVVHIQHEFGLYGAQHGIQINELVLRLRMADLPVAVTLHTVRSPMLREDRIILKNIVQDSSLVIVHEHHQKQILEEAFGATGSVQVIPHGIRRIKAVPAAKKLLGVEGKKTALLAGYFRPTKRFERILRIWPEVVKKCPEALLVFAGKMRTLESSDYYRMLMELADHSPVRENILVLRGQFPQHTFDTLFSAADCMLLPYEAGAQSGILANAAAFHVPVVTSDLKSFDQWNSQSGGGLTARSDREFIDHICLVLGDRTLQRKMRKNIENYIRPMLWEHVAPLHHDLYETIARKPIGPSRYFYVPG